MEQERVQRKLQRRLSDLSTLTKTERKRMRDELELMEYTEELSDSNISTALQAAIDNANKQNFGIAQEIREVRKSSTEEKRKRDERIEGERVLLTETINEITDWTTDIKSHLRSKKLWKQS